MKEFSIKLKKCVFIAIAMVLVVMLVIGCSNFLTGNDADEPIGPMQIMSYYDFGHIDEVWLIDTGAEGRSGLTLEEIISIIERNQGYFTIDNEVDYELLRNFVLSNFEYVEIIVDDDDIEELLRHVHFCCVYDPETKTLTVRVIVK